MTYEIKEPTDEEISEVEQKVRCLAEGFIEDLTDREYWILQNIIDIKGVF